MSRAVSLHDILKIHRLPTAGRKYNPNEDGRTIMAALNYRYDHSTLLLYNYYRINTRRVLKVGPLDDSKR